MKPANTKRINKKNKKMAFFRKTKWLWFISCIIIILPFFIGFFYNLNSKQIIPIEMGDLLSYYATAFAIPGSFAVLYVTRNMELNDRKMKKEEQDEKEVKENEPHFTLTLEESGQYFNLTINGCGKGKYRNIYFYDNRICDIWTQEQYKYRLYFETDRICNPKIANRVIRINDTFLGLDENDYPLEFYIMCEEVKIGAIYLCCYKMHVENEKIYYLQDNIDVIDWRQ